MRFLGIFLMAGILAFAQEPAGGGGRGGGRGAAAGPPAGTNLKILAPNTDIQFVMRNFNTALGVQCTYCHVAGNFASDDNPKKDVARKMISLVRSIDHYFPGSTGQFPGGAHEVDCGTCHRGQTHPDTKAKVQFYNRNESLGNTPPAPTPGVALKVLPPDTQVHGEGSVMEDYRDSLTVECAYCHGGGKPFEADVNPRKEIARQMILMVREINAQFPGTGVYPKGKQEVTCYTCHRAAVHPTSWNDINYGPPAAKK